MPKSKRSPIDYTPQFGQGIFRPRDVVESELAEAQDDEMPKLSADAESPVGNDQTASRPSRSSRAGRRGNEQTNVRTNERTKIRHTFDIYKDQLRSLRGISLERETATGKRILLGDLMQEALDLFIEKERTK